MQVITIGRDSKNDVVINEDSISRHHVQIIREGDSYRIVDFNSTNGTYVNSVRIRGEMQLVPGDEVCIGSTPLPWQDYFGSSTAAVGIPNSSRNGVLIGAGIFVAVIALLAGLYFFSPDFRKGFNEEFNKATGIILPGSVRFSSLSTEEQKKLKADLFERLDRYFLSIIKNDEALMRLFMLGAISENSELLEKRIGKEMIEIVKQWGIDNDIDLEDWGNSMDAEEFAVDYLMHLMQQIRANE
jgi:hypothetical protein